MEKLANLTLAAHGSNGQKPRESNHADTIQISKSEYENLLRASAELDNLKTLLLERGGSSEKKGSTDADSKPTTWADDSESSNASSIEIPSPRRKRKSISNSSNDGDESSEGGDDDENLAKRPARKQSSTRARRQNNETADGRGMEPCTVTLKFPCKVTHADITAAVRGGALMQVDLPAHHEVAHVTFVEAESAKTFVEYAQAGPFFVAGQPTSVHWCHRQWYPGPYIRQRVTNSQATRNLVIHDVRRNITEAVIRSDMCHIHRMAIIYVHFSGGNVYISTNSVNNALFARTCMLSRTLYKGLQIGFFPDDCDQPLPQIRAYDGMAKPAEPAKMKGPVYNPYDVLSLSGVSNEDEADDDGDGENRQGQEHDNGVDIPVW